MAGPFLVCAVHGVKKIYVAEERFFKQCGRATVFFEFETEKALEEAALKAQQFRPRGIAIVDSVFLKKAPCSLGFSAIWRNKKESIRSASSLIEQVADAIASPNEAMKTIPAEKLDMDRKLEWLERRSTKSPSAK